MTRKTNLEIAAIFRDRRAIDQALLSAHRRVLRLYQRAGVSLAIWRDGRVVEISADSIQLPDDPSPGMDAGDR